MLLHYHLLAGPGLGAHIQVVGSHLVPLAWLNSGVSGPNAVGTFVIYSQIPILWRFVLSA